MLRQIFLFVSLSLIVVPHLSSTANILSLSFMSTPSHKITYDPLLQALAARNHTITVCSPVPSTKTVPNIREILTFNHKEISANSPDVFAEKAKGKQSDILDKLPQMLRVCEVSLELPHVRALQEQKFDLIFVLAIQNECALAFASTFNTPMILISPLGVLSTVSTWFGNAAPTSFVPNFFFGLTDRMNFIERTANFGEGIYRAAIHLYIRCEIERVVRNKLGPEIPSLDNLFRRASLILSNSHYSISTLNPFLPDILEVGGMHCRDARPLPKNFEDFLSTSGDEGFILFSMGSVLQGNQMPAAKQKLLLNVFGQLKLKVIWKWESDQMENVTRNILLSKWVPQQDVLGHSKIKAFITHGGFGSTIEAVYHGVPVIGLPIFADQILNMQKATVAGYGITLDFNTFTEESLANVIQEIVTSPKYKAKAQRISTLLRDQPTHPLDRAVYWSEYVIRHKGARHLRSAGRDLNFVQYHSIDVIGFLLFALLLIMFVAYKAMRLLLSLVYSVVFNKRKYNPAGKYKKRI